MYYMLYTYGKPYLDFHVNCDIKLNRSVVFSNIQSASNSLADSDLGH